MDKLTNYNDKTIKKLVKEFAMKPLFTRVIITLNREMNEGGVIMNENPLSETQYVVAAGGSAQVKAGDKILLDLTKMTVKVPLDTDKNQMIETIKVDPLKTEQGVFAFIYDNQIKAIFN
jgi:hypothetical protein